MTDESNEGEYETYEESWTGRITIVAVVAVALIAGAFFAGKALAGGGPATLAEAVEQAQAGDLPCGETAAPAGGAAANASATPGAGGGGASGYGGPPQGAAGGGLLRGICNRGDAADGQQQAGNGGPGGAGGFGGFGQTGQVTAVSADSITIQSPMGDVTIKLDGSTTVSKSASGSVSDIEAGDTVLVSGGGRNGDEAATSVTIIPATGGS